MAIVYKLLTEKIIVELLLTMLWGNTLDEWVNIAQDSNPDNISDAWESYPMQTLITGHHYVSDNQTTPSLCHPTLTSALEAILMVTFAAVRDTFKIVIDGWTAETWYTLVDAIDAENPDYTNGYVNTCINKLGWQWSIHIASYNMIQFRAGRLSNGQLSNVSSSLGIFDNSGGYRMINTVGWWIQINGWIPFNLHVTATAGYNSLFDR